MTEEYNTYDFYYDEEGDFLELSLSEPAEDGTTEEIEEGIFITRNINTKRITNIGILDFRKRVQVLKQTLNRLKIPFPLEISLSNS